MKGFYFLLFWEHKTKPHEPERPGRAEEARKGLGNFRSIGVLFSYLTLREAGKHIYVLTLRNHH